MIPLTTRTKALFAPVSEDFYHGDQVDIASSDDGNFIVDFYQTSVDSNGKSYRRLGSRALRQVCSRLPEALACKGSGNVGYYNPYKVPATDCNVEIIAQLIPADRINFIDQEARDTFNSIRAEATLADHCSKLLADYKEHGLMPHHNYELNADKPLKSYQQVALCCQQAQAGFALFFEQGCGKTPVSIAAICNGSVNHRENGGYGFYKVLIVVPNNVKRNWVDEFDNFATRPGRVTILRGSPEKRFSLICDAFAPAQTLPDGTTEDIYYSAVITSYQSLWRTWQTLKLFEWDLSILDEAHNIVSTKAIQSEACITLRDHSKQRLVLTGTPIRNNPLDIYMLLEFMDRNGSGFSNYKAFRDYFGKTQQAQSGQTILTGFHNLAFLQERVLRKSMFISKKEALPHLPDKVYDIIDIEMTPDQRKAYDDLQSQLALEIENMMDDDTKSRSMLVQCILTKLLRLSQITSGFVCWDSVDDIDGTELQPEFYEYFSPNPKIDAAMDLVLEKTDPTEKTIIWAKWIPDIEYLSHAATYHGIKHSVVRGLHKGYKEADKQEAIRQYNEDPECRLLIGTQASGGTGLNLLGYKPHHQDEYDTDTTHMIYMSQGWSYVERDQSEARGHREGSRRPVRYTTLIAENSIDEEIYDRVASKKNSALEMSDMRKLLHIVLGKKVEMV